MIFATVGTHEEPFDRLLLALESIAAEPGWTEPIVVQAGYTHLATPRLARHELLPFARVQDLMSEARVIISHGGPATIMQALAHGKVPIVVPRQARHGEHVDDHQVQFARRISDRVVVIEDIAALRSALGEHDARQAAARPDDLGPGRAAAFAARMSEVCGDLASARAKVARG
jgi:UDP-N-acetylglucosamine transferase subunit ALG13